MKRVLVIQNCECEPLGRFSEANAQFTYIRPYLDSEEPVPDSLEDWDALIILGGPLAVYEMDANPFLADELNLILLAISRDFPTLGICLGSQLIAQAAGGRVYAGSARELGWDTVELTDTAADDALFSGLPETIPVFQLHGDTFELPQAALRLAGSAVYPNQAFRIGRNIYGLQFHIEVTDQLVRDWVEIYDDYLTGGGVAGSKIVEDLPARVESLRPIAVQLIDRFLKLAAPA